MAGRPRRPSSTIRTASPSIRPATFSSPIRPTAGSARCPRTTSGSSARPRPRSASTPWPGRASAARPNGEHRPGWPSSSTRSGWPPTRSATSSSPTEATSPCSTDAIAGVVTGGGRRDREQWAVCLRWALGHRGDGGAQRCRGHRARVHRHVHHRWGAACAPGRALRHHGDRRTSHDGGRHVHPGRRPSGHHRRRAWATARSGCSPTCNAPTGIVVAPTGAVFVSDAGSGRVLEIR